MSRRTTSAALERATRVMFTRIMTGLARTLRDEELTISQVAALHLLDEGGAHRVAVLGDLLGLSPSAASRMTDALVQRELVDRSEDPADRRARVLQLTPKGRALVEGMGADRVATILDAAGSLPTAMTTHVLDAVVRAAARLEKRR